MKVPSDPILRTPRGVEGLQPGCKWPPTDREVFVFPEHQLKSLVDIPHGATWPQCRVLHRYAALVAEDQYVLEIGSFIGRTTCAMGLGAPHAAKLVSIDPFMGESYVVKNIGDAEAIFKSNIKRVSMANPFPPFRHFKLSSLETQTVEAFRDAMWGLKYGFLFIDGLHAYEPNKRDIELWVKPLVPSGGFVAFHDYTPQWTGIICNVNDLIDNHGFDLYEKCGSLVVLRRR